MSIIEGSVLDPAVIAEKKRLENERRAAEIKARIERLARDARRRVDGPGDNPGAISAAEHGGLVPGLTLGFDLDAAINGFVEGTLSTASPLSGFVASLVSGISIGNSGRGRGATPNSQGGRGIAGLGDTSGHGGQGDASPGGTGGGGGGVGDGQGGGPAGASCCFIAGTKVLSQVGHKNIEDIEPGDIVRSYDLDTGNFVESIVGTTKSVIRDVYYEIHFESGNVLSVTDDHPLYTREGWASIKPQVTEANELYDRIDSINELTQSSAIMHESGHFDNVVTIKRIKGKVTTYTLGNIAPNANFFAGLYLASNYAC
jgi:hypothetical protein